LRCGLAIGRPDLIEKLASFSGWNRLPVTAVAAAITSLRDPALVPERKKVNAAVRAETFVWLERNGYSYTPSVSNFFMLDTRRPSKETIDAMAKRNVFIGRAWPIWPTHVRITVGTKPDMEKFQLAFHEVMQAKPAGILLPEGRRLSVRLDERSFRAGV
jgi:histidinol-phosphate aminotransferase